MPLRNITLPDGEFLRTSVELAGDDEVYHSVVATLREDTWQDLNNKIRELESEIRRAAHDVRAAHMDLRDFIDEMRRDNANRHSDIPQTSGERFDPLQLRPGSDRSEGGL